MCVVTVCEERELDSCEEQENARPPTATQNDVGRRRALEWASWRRFRPQWTAIAAATANATARAATAATAAGAAVTADVHQGMVGMHE